MIAVPCDYCGSTATKLVFETNDTNYHFPGTFRVVSCRQCGLVFLNPRPSDDEIEALYPDGDYSCFHVEGSCKALSPTHPTLTTAAARGLTIHCICDVGCGIGDFLCAAQQAGLHVYGVEPNRYARVPQHCGDKLGVAPGRQRLVAI